MDLKKLLPRNIRGKLMSFFRFLPDELYIKLFYFSVSGKWLDLKHPKGFNEKQNWLKLHDLHPEYSDLVDKYAVRAHIDAVLGEGHMFPLLGKWEHFDEIDFSALPDAFVLKCNHDSGSTKIIRDKASLTQAQKEELRAFYERRLKRDFFYAGREYPYKGIKKHYILAEQLMEDEAHPGRSVEDFKFFCFGGVPKIMLVVTDRSTDCRSDYFDMDFNHLDLRRNHPNAEKPLPRPELFDEMKAIAAKLSAGMRFVRIDLYQLNGKVYFGEYTFFAGGAFAPWEPEEWEYRIGDWIDLGGLQ